MKIIYNYDSESGRFLQESEADESPLEPGVYLIPAFATDIAPPSAPDGQYAAFINGAWQLLDEPEPEIPENPLPPTQAEIKRTRIVELKALLASTDYKALPDYDNATEADFTQRSQWRMEIRMLVSELEQDGE